MKSIFGGDSADTVQIYAEQGRVFEAALVVQAAVGTPIFGLFRTGPKAIMVLNRSVRPNGNEITYQAFKDPTLLTNGTPYTGIVNRNNIIDTQTTVQMFLGPTVSSEGLALPPMYIPGTEGQGHRGNGQFEVDGAVRILPPFTDYLTKITNAGLKDPAKVELYLMWAEFDMPIGYGD